MNQLIQKSDFKNKGDNFKTYHRLLNLQHGWLTT